jgi:hypothetical protein
LSIQSLLLCFRAAGSQATLSVGMALVSSTRQFNRQIEVVAATRQVRRHRFARTARGAASTHKPFAAVQGIPPGRLVHFLDENAVWHWGRYPARVQRVYFACALPEQRR